MQAKLDVIANNEFINTLKNRGEVCGMAPEELEEYLSFDDEINKV